LAQATNKLSRKTIRPNSHSSEHALVNAAKISEKYQAFIQTSNEGIWCIELEQPIPISLPASEQISRMFRYGYFAEANEAMAAMYGFKSTEDLIGLPLREILLEEDPQNIAYLQAFIESGYRLSGVDSHEVDSRGDHKYFRNSLVGIQQDGVVLRAWGTQQDVTEQRLAVEALQKSQERLALAFKASHMGIWEWDIRNDKLEWSDELKQVFGLAPNEEVTFERYSQELLHPEDAPLMQKTIEKALKTGEEYCVEHRIVWPDGTVHWLQGQGKAYYEDGAPIRMVGTSMDISKRKEAELEVQESEQRFRTMADTAPVLIWVSNQDKQCVYLNKMWLDFTGRATIGEHLDGWVESIHPEDAERAANTYLSSFDARKPFTMEYRLRRRDGRYRWVFCQGIPRFSPDGTFVGYIGSCVDVHNVKRSEKLAARNEVLRQQRSQLVALNKSKDEFISLASHQLRTPASAVKQYVGMILEGYAGDLSPQQHGLLKTAYESNERQLTIVDDLLKVAHVDSGKMKLKKRAVNLVRLLESVIDDQADIFRSRNQVVHFKPVVGRVMATVDEPHMRMAFENLISNAGKYSHHNKQIDITIQEDKTSIAVAIADKGVGISQDDMHKLFQKFSRIENPLSVAVGGNGLGLYWTKHIVAMHKGKIDVISEQGKGSVFTVRIPREIPVKLS
jgi:PAS domain S-box-containing protein